MALVTLASSPIFKAIYALRLLTHPVGMAPTLSLVVYSNPYGTMS